MTISLELSNILDYYLSFKPYFQITSGNCQK